MGRVTYTKRDTYYLGKWPLFSKKSQYAEHNTDRDDDDDRDAMDLTKRIVEHE